MSQNSGNTWQRNHIQRTFNAVQQARDIIQLIHRPLIGDVGNDGILHLLQHIAGFTQYRFLCVR